MVHIGRLTLKRKAILIAVLAISTVSMLTVIYASLTGQIQMTGTAINRKSNWKIQIENLQEVELTGTAEEVNAPTIKRNVELSDYLVTLTNPGDSVEYSFDISNKGDYDAVVSQVSIPEPECRGAGEEAISDATKVCNHLTYTLTDAEGNEIEEDDLLPSQSTKTLKLKLVYDSNTPVSDYPKDDVAISNLGISLLYVQAGTVKANSDGSTPKTRATTTLLSKANDTSVTTYVEDSEASHQMYTFEHPKTEQTGALTDYRYIGSDPYNYVDFNGETWRIIGIFTVEGENGNKEQRIKIIKDEKLPSGMAWDSNELNDWPTATLNTYLNGEYYNSLSSTAKEMISPAKTYLGGGREDPTTHFGTAEDMYSWERGTDRYSEHSMNDTKNISLIYPSDYTYAYAKGIDNTCFNDVWNCRTNLGGNPSKGWLYNSHLWWTVSPYADYSVRTFFVHSTGDVGNYGLTNTNGACEVRPVVYLIPEIQFDGNHTGSSSDHYVLKK